MICDVCQQPISDADVQERTITGEPAHASCLTDRPADITAGDVEGAREMLLDDDRLEEASAEYRAGWVDALIALDLALTNPEALRSDDN